MSRKPILIKQHDITDCGAACISSISGFYKLKVPIARIRQIASTDTKGTNVLGMIEAVQSLGFQAKGVKGTIDDISKAPLPAIAHVVLNKSLNHYVVLYDVKQSFVKIMDPADGKIHKKTIEDFKKIWTGALIILLPSTEFQIGNYKTSIYSRFWHLLLPHKTVLSQTLFGVLGLSTSIYIQKITDYVIPNSNQKLLNLLSIGMIFLLFLQIIINYTKSLFALKTGQKIDAQLILGYYRHLLTLPQQFFDSMRVGEIISRVNDAVKIRLFINDILIEIVVNVLIICFSFILMFTYYWKIALILLLALPMYFIIYYYTNILNKRQQRTLMQSSAGLETQLVESISIISTIKRFNIEDYTNIKTEVKFIQLLKGVFASSITAIYSSIGNDFISKLFVIILMWLGGYFVIQNEISSGELMSFYALLGYLTVPVGKLITANKSIQEALIAADRLFEIIDLEREQEVEKIEIIDELIGDIALKNVSFRYGSRVQVFNNFSAIIPKSQITAIVGESGSGKTTLISLLQNLYPIRSGKITIGNYDIRHIKNESLRNKVVVVPQKVELLAGNIIENIALGDLAPDMFKILKICEQLGISEFVQRFPHGFGTYIGENGVNLSGGERQRLAIARAIYKEPEILILDEATSSLDSISEKYVQDTIRMLRLQKKTIIIIAHRLSTVKNSDMILILKNGNLIEQGCHVSLIEQKGEYAKLWNQQFDII